MNIEWSQGKPTRVELVSAQANRLRWRSSVALRVAGAPDAGSETSVRLDANKPVVLRPR